jgi:hypothetical protein
MARAKKWAVVTPVNGKIKMIASGHSGKTGWKIGWTSSKLEATQTALLTGGVVVDADLLANSKTRNHCLRAAGLGRFIKKPPAKKATKPARKKSAPKRRRSA